MQQREYVNSFVDGSKLMLLFRTPAGELRAQSVQAEYVSYYEKNDKLEAIVRRSQYVASFKAEGNWLRVGWRNEQVRKDMTLDERSPIVQMGLKSFEGDVDPVCRYFVDSAAPIAKPKPIYLDIETDSRVPFSRKEDMRVLIYSLIDQDFNVVAKGVLEEDTDIAEKALLDSMWLALKPYDQVIAWSGDGFDFPVIFERSRRRKCGVDARKWLWLDHLVLFEKLNKHSAESGDEKSSMKLQDIAMAKLGEGKEEVPDYVAERWPGRSLGALSWELWEAGGQFRQLLLDYCIKDSILLAKIEKKTGYIALFQTICEACHILGNTSSLNPTKQMDGFMMRLGLERGYHFQTKKFFESSAEFKGAFVMTPKSLSETWRQKQGMTTGILRGVHVCDFSGMYPSIILTWNMSPDTKVLLASVNGPIPAGQCRSPSTGASFKTDVHGILVTALKEMMRLRKFYNDKKSEYAPRTPEWYDADRKSTAYKVTANSFYGVIGSAFSRFYDRVIAESVTQNGVWLLEQTMHAATERGFENVYGDTDSIFTIKATDEQFTDFVKFCNEELYPRLLKEQGCVENHIKLAYEKKFKLLTFTSAKRYVGVYEHYKGKPATANSKPEIKGLEFNRGDASKGARELQGSVIDLIVKGSETLEDYHAVVSRVRTHVLEENLPIDEVKISKSLSKPIGEYTVKLKADGTAASQPPHVMIAKVMKERGLEVREGTRIEYIVTDGSVSPMKVIPATDYDNNCDRFHIWESMVFPPTFRLLAATFPEHDWESWLKVRPAKLRGKRTKVLEGQLALPESEKRVMVTSTKPFAGDVFEVKELLAAVDILKKANSPVVDGKIEFPIHPDSIAAKLAMDATNEFVMEEKKLLAAKKAFAPVVTARPRRGPYKLRIPAHADMKALKAVLEDHRGSREVILTIVLPDGSEADLVTELKVSGSLQLSAELERFKMPSSGISEGAAT